MKKIVYMVGFILLLLGANGCRNEKEPIQNKIEQSTDWQGDKLIGHAFGNVNGISYTNSLEAFKENYNNGIRTFEVDFQLTSDKKVVLSHNWDRDLQKDISSNNIPTEEKFLNTKILEVYTPLSLKDLIILMKEYPDIWIVTDSKYTDQENIMIEFNELRKIAKQTDSENILDRFIIQIYNEEMYNIVKEIYPFKNIIFTLYMRWDGNYNDFASISVWSKARNIKGITMWSDLFDQTVFDLAKNSSLDIYVHTVNDIELAKNQENSGVRGFYTDSIKMSTYLKQN